MAELFLHDKMQTEAGQTFFMHDSMSTITVTTELEDISNDFRMVLPPEEVYDINNDFRMYGTFAKLDINNDFRFVDYAIDNVNNDFRMVGEIVRSPLLNDFRTKKEELDDINNKFDTVKEEIIDIDNKVNSCIEVVSNIDNMFASIKEEVEDISNDFRTKKEVNYDINNDFRMLSIWQVPTAGEVGFQSAGKSEVKVYIASSEQTDVDIDSITINQVLNGTSTASFNLGRPYDDTKPNVKSIVEIKYKDILLYKGYITEINPTDTPESIKIVCQDEYWNLNNTKKYFLVGRQPANTNELYYETIEDALNTLGFSRGIGNFIPQTKNLYGSGTADAISDLVQDSGNFSWFINSDGTKVLWEAGRGNIVDLEPQATGTNIGLYQVIKHSIRENIANIINRLKVQMGNWTIRRTSDNISDGTGTKTYLYTQVVKYEEYGVPAWDEDLEKLMKDTADGFGYDNPDPEKDYKDVFRKFWIPGFSTGWTIIGNHTESLTDLYPPLIEVWSGRFWSQTREYINEGFSLDYGYKPPFGSPISDLGRPFISFSQPMANYDTNSSNELVRVTPKKVKLYLWKEFRWSFTVDEQTDPDQEPLEDIENPLMFYTDKMGDYSETITGDLNLPSLSKQDGFVVRGEEGEIIDIIPSWDDTEFARDYADWQLSKTCDKEILGSVELTIDAMVYYNIDLSKRIKISGVVDPINIKGITYNFGDFTAILQVESERYYRRTESLPYHGE